MDKRGVAGNEREGFPLKYFYLTVSSIEKYRILSLALISEIFGITTCLKSRQKSI